MNEATKKKRAFLIRFLWFALILGIVIFLCRKALPALITFVIAFVVALIIKPVVRLLNEKLRLSRGIAALLCTLLFYLLAGGLAVLLSIRCFSLVRDLVVQLPGYYRDSLRPALIRLYKLLGELTGRLNPEATAIVDRMASSAATSLEQFVVSLSAKLVSALGTTAVSVPGFLLNCLITVIATVFIASDFPLIRRFIIAQLTERQHETLHACREHLNTTLKSYTRSYVLILFMTFCELSVGLLLIGVKRAVLVSFFIALFDILPIVGSGSVLCPWAVISLLQGNYAKAIELFLLYVVIAIVRNTMEPKIVGKRVGLHPIVTLMAMVVGTLVFGPIGLLGLPVTLAVMTSLNEAGVIQLYVPVHSEKQNKAKRFSLSRLSRRGSEGNGVPDAGVSAEPDEKTAPVPAEQEPSLIDSTPDPSETDEPD